jgi:regulator of sigma E protease
VAPESPALAAGIQVGDQVLSVSDTIITLDHPLNAEIKEHLGKPVTLVLWRDGAWVEANLTPRVDPPQGQGAIGVQISPVTEMAALSLPAALWEGVLSTAEYAGLVLQLPVMLLQGQLSPEEAQITGPVGIAQMVGGAVSATIDTGLWFPILRLSAVLSAALAITNLLPLPALDGGRLLFLLIEMVRGRRVSPEREGLIHMVGFMVLLGLMLVITVRDLSTTPQSIDWAKLMGQ